MYDGRRTPAWLCASRRTDSTSLTNTDLWSQACPSPNTLKSGALSPHLIAWKPPLACDSVSSRQPALWRLCNETVSQQKLPHPMVRVQSGNRMGYVPRGEEWVGKASTSPWHRSYRYSRGSG